MSIGGASGQDSKKNTPKNTPPKKKGMVVLGKKNPSTPSATEPTAQTSTPIAWNKVGSSSTATDTSEANTPQKKAKQAWGKIKTQNIIPATDETTSPVSTASSSSLRTLSIKDMNRIADTKLPALEEALRVAEDELFNDKSLEKKHKQRQEEKTKQPRDNNYFVRSLDSQDCRVLSALYNQATDILALAEGEHERYKQFSPAVQEAIERTQILAAKIFKATTPEAFSLCIPGLYWRGSGGKANEDDSCKQPGKDMEYSKADFKGQHFRDEDTIREHYISQGVNHELIIALQAMVLANTDINQPALNYNVYYSVIREKNPEAYEKLSTKDRKLMRALQFINARGLEIKITKEMLFAIVLDKQGRLTTPMMGDVAGGKLGHLYAGPRTIESIEKTIERLKEIKNSLNRGHVTRVINHLQKQIQNIKDYPSSITQKLFQEALSAFLPPAYILREDKIGTTRRMEDIIPSIDDALRMATETGVEEDILFAHDILMKHEGNISQPLRDIVHSSALANVPTFQVELERYLKKLQKSIESSQEYTSSQRLSKKSVSDGTQGIIPEPKFEPRKYDEIMKTPTEYRYPMPPYIKTAQVLPIWEELSTDIKKFKTITIESNFDHSKKHYLGADEMPMTNEIYEKAVRYLSDSDREMLVTVRCADHLDPDRPQASMAIMIPVYYPTKQGLAQGKKPTVGSVPNTLKSSNKKTLYYQKGYIVIGGISEDKNDLSSYPHITEYIRVSEYVGENDAPFAIIKGSNITYLANKSLRMTLDEAEKRIRTVKST